MGEFKPTMSLDELRQRHDASQQAAAQQQTQKPPPPPKQKG